MEIKFRLSGVSQHTCRLDKPQHFVALKRVTDLQPLWLAEGSIESEERCKLE